MDYIKVNDKYIPKMSTQDGDPAMKEPVKRPSRTPGDDPDLQRKVRVMFPDLRKPEACSGAYNTPLTATDDLFQAFSKDADIEFLADSFYDAQPALPKDIRDQPLGAALDEFARRLNSTWERPHALFLFRNAHWYVLDDQDASAKSTRRWVRYWSERYHLKQALQRKEFTALAFTLTGAQIRAFGQMNPLADAITGVAGPFAVYEALDAPQRLRMSSTEGMVWKKLTATQQRLLLDRVPVKARPTVIERLNGDPDSRLRLREVEGKLVSEFTVKGEWQRDVAVPTECPPKGPDFDGAVWLKDMGSY